MVCAIAADTQGEGLARLTIFDLKSESLLPFVNPPVMLGPVEEP